eukprot:TRINITY_DN10037_c0_g1_i1.p1 TRINITY_DN10037_c0_g1~~TRINITY_DN10037_c0_g1_i1.p1  ORF type:complete len:277 (+),score=110.40 TRINITY_DN10037_c0_g1_i1:209-1039(+)
MEWTGYGNMSQSAEKFLSLVDQHGASDALLQLDVGSADAYWLVGLVAAVYGGFAFYSLAPDVLHSGSSDEIPATDDQKKHKLTVFDLWCVAINKAVTVFFTYHTAQWAWWHAVWRPLVVSDVAAVPLQLLVLFAIYEFFYYWFHRFLHVPAVYPLLHKHHHQQHAPFRGNIDAINTHPIEYIVGDYDHLFSLYLLACAVPVHVLTAVLFVVIGGYFASLNHTRYNVMLHPWVFAVGAHDVHHRIDVRSNYGQYVMIWDVLFGTFKASPPIKGAKLS